MSGLLYETAFSHMDIDTAPAEEFDLFRDSLPEPPNPTDFILDLVREAKNYEAEAKAIDARAKELRDKKAAKDRAAQRLRDWAKSEMLARDLNKCKDADYTVSLAKPKAKLVITDKDKVPDEYWVVSRDVSKAALNEAFTETGEVPDGCDVETTRTLTVRG